MPEKNKQLSISILIILGFVLSLVLLLRTPSPIKNTALLREDGKINLSLPVRLKIPKINIDATVDHVGLAPDGTMDVPNSPENTAWFNLGPRPGEIGSSVIDGHSGLKNNTPAVFDNLYKLQKGNKIYVEDSSGTITTFVVREIRTYKNNEEVPEVFNSSDNQAHLNLITCTGAWNDAEKTRSDRLVIFSDKE
ncbi:MAG: class F sortase [bacterium]|nr:class F sortase [bacterium]